MRASPTLGYRGAAVVLALVVVYGGLDRPRARPLTLDDVMRNAAHYLARFQKQLSGMVAEETYVQEVKQQGLWNPMAILPRRILRSDLLLVKPTGADRYVEFRDVFEVDGQPVRNREDRLTRLLRDSSTEATNQMAALINESARYNIGAIRRNVNTPLLALTFLDPAYQPRFEFKRARKDRQEVKSDDALETNDGPVFRTSTEMWAIEYRERRKGTVIRMPNGRDLPARGRFWIDPTTGAVLISELVVNGGGVSATITVSYQSEPLMGYVVPIAMRESYVSARERVMGSASYGRFRQIPP